MKRRILIISSLLMMTIFSIAQTTEAEKYLTGEIKTDTVSTWTKGGISSLIWHKLR